MENIWKIVLAIALFIIITFLYWKMTKSYAEKEYGKVFWKHWGAKMYYWTGALFFSGGITVALIYLFKG